MATSAEVAIFLLQPGLISRYSLVIITAAGLLPGNGPLLHASLQERVMNGYRGIMNVLKNRICKTG